MLSFIIPAHNEQALLGRTLASVHAAARALNETYEILVVDDASTDQTAGIARDQGARVVSVQFRHIAATRNAGARAAAGDLLFFVDADTLANPEAVSAAVRALRQGAVGGGCVFQFDGKVPLWIHVLYLLSIPAMRLFKIVGGCFLFCTREAFATTGGFCESYYAAEEIAFVRALKRQGRFVVPGPRVITSGRKVRNGQAGKGVLSLLRLALGGPQSFRTRRGLDLWYGERKPDALSNR